MSTMVQIMCVGGLRPAKRRFYAVRRRLGQRRLRTGSGEIQCTSANGHPSWQAVTRPKAGGGPAVLISGSWASGSRRNESSQATTSDWHSRISHSAKRQGCAHGRPRCRGVDRDFRTATRTLSDAEAGVRCLASRNDVEAGSASASSGKARARNRGGHDRSHHAPNR